MLAGVEDDIVRGGCAYELLQLMVAFVTISDHVSQHRSEDLELTFVEFGLGRKFAAKDK